MISCVGTTVPLTMLTSASLAVATPSVIVLPAAVASGNAVPLANRLVRLGWPAV